MNPQRFGLYVLFALGSVALLLTMLGTYVAADSLVANRKRELCIRLALGAGHGRIRGLVLFDSFRLVGTGLLIGVVFTLFGARLMRSLLFQVSPFDASVLLTACALILSLALMITLRPAISATRTDLTRTLKEE